MNNPKTAPSAPAEPAASARRGAKKSRSVGRQSKAPALLSAVAAGKDLRRRLNLIHDVVVTVAIAMKCEGANHDLYFANVLIRCAADPLSKVISDHLGDEDSQP